MANPEDLGRYHLKRLLGRGALGQVWEAVDREAEATKFAVKIMHAADEELTLARIQFSREARLASLLRHPNVARVHDAGEAAGTSFMVMEMVDGTPLRRLIGDASVGIDERLRWLGQIAEGIAALHAGNIVHRDVKPENVIIRPDRTACLVDFGIAKWRKFERAGERDPLEEHDAEPFAPPITDYAPPEAIEAHLYDELGDQYAWGALAYALLTGEPPAEGAAPLTERDGISADVAQVVERARSRDRKQRWGSMPELLDAFDGARSSKPSPPRSGSGSGAPGVSRTATTDSPPPSGRTEGATAEEPPPGPSKGRSSLLLAGAAAVALLAIVVFILAGLR